MDHGCFDALTRTVGAGGTRRAIFRFLAGGAIGGVATRLGLAMGAEAKGTRHASRKGRKKRTARAERNPHGEPQAEGKRKGKKFQRKPPKPPKPPQCGPNLRPCADGSCIPTNQCCPGLKLCSGEGCIPVNECCETEVLLCVQCQEPVCDTSTGKYTCRSICPSGFSCCNGLCEPPCENGCTEEPSRACLCERPPDGMKYCAAAHVCVDRTQCCPNATPPSCGQCEQAVCEGGELVCRATTPPTCQHCEEAICDNGTWICRRKDGPCCPAGSNACGSGVSITCCPSGTSCCSSARGNGCCASGWECCEGACCQPGWRCCSGFGCLPQDSSCPQP